MAESHPDAIAVVDQRGTVWTNRRLNDESDRAAEALRNAGIKRGMRAVLMVPPSLPFFSLTFALFKIGAVPVLIDPGMGIRGLGQCIAEAEPEAFIGVAKAHFARILFGWGRRTLRINIWRTPGISPGVRVTNVQHPPADAGGSPDEVAAILFTSGSTGPAKGAIYTHGMFAAQIEALRRMFDIRPDEVDLCTFPLFALFAPALGMSAIIPDMNPTRPAQVNPRKLFEAVRKWNCTNLFGSPAMLNALGRAGPDPHPRLRSRIAGRGEEGMPALLPTLKRVVSAGAPVPASAIERMQKLLAPGTPIYTPYGATECLPVACIDSATILGETRALTDQGKGICVGTPVPEVEIAVIPVSDEPIAEWNDSLRQGTNTIGEIAVRGPFVSPAYLNRPESTRLAKIPDGAGGVWHRMGDLGYLDDRGRLWFCGRKAHRVWTADGPLDTICCEAIFNTHPAVFRSALVGVGAKGQQTPIICVELEREQRGVERGELTRQLLEIGAKFEHTRGIRTVLYHKTFPVDVRHNAKINREKLAAWAAKRVSLK